MVSFPVWIVVLEPKYSADHETIGPHPPGCMIHDRRFCLALFSDSDRAAVYARQVESKGYFGHVLPFKNTVELIEFLREGRDLGLSHAIIDNDECAARPERAIHIQNLIDELQASIHSAAFG